MRLGFELVLRTKLKGKVGEGEMAEVGSGGVGETGPTVDKGRLGEGLNCAYTTLHCIRVRIHV